MTIIFNKVLLFTSLTIRYTPKREIDHMEERRILPKTWSIIRLSGAGKKK